MIATFSFRLWGSALHFEKFNVARSTMQKNQKFVANNDAPFNAISEGGWAIFLVTWSQLGSSMQNVSCTTILATQLQCLATHRIGIFFFIDICWNPRGKIQIKEFYLSTYWLLDLRIECRASSSSFIFLFLLFYLQIYDFFNIMTTKVFWYGKLILNCHCRHIMSIMCLN